MPASRRSDPPRWTRRAGLARLSAVARTLPPCVVLALVAIATGCGGAPSPGQAPPPGQALLPPTNVVSSASDSVGARPGSAIALFVYKFRQLSPPGSFSYKDRDLNFSFRPSPNVLYFGVENLQGRPVTIDWDRSVFYEPSGSTSKVGHTPTRWRDRFSTQTPTQVTPQQRYTDYVFAMDDLLDPGADEDTQLRRPILPEDSSAPTYSGKEFGVDLVFMIENQPRTYTIRFQVQSVMPR